MCQSSDKLIKRAKRKFLNVPVLTHLLKLNSPIHSKYVETLSCSSLIQQEDGKIKSRYCKRTWCAICSPIRTAVRIENYKGALALLEDLQFTTLTMPNVPAWEIKNSIQIFRKIFRQFRDSYNKKNVDSAAHDWLMTFGDLENFEPKDHIFKGVYNFEVTYNVQSGLFHPHIHILHQGLDFDLKILPGKGKFKGTQAFHLYNELVTYWLKNMPTADLQAQDARPCTDLIEGFKYQTKSIFQVKVNGKKEHFIPVAELDQIYQQLAGLRCFQPFGIEKISEEKIEALMNELTAYETSKPAGSYKWKRNDWVLEQNIDSETGEVLIEISDSAIKLEVVLTGYVPDQYTEKIFLKATENKHYKKRGNEQSNKKVESTADNFIETIYGPLQYKEPSKGPEDLQRIFIELRQKSGDAFNQFGSFES